MPLSIAANSDTDPYIARVLADDPTLSKGNGQRYNMPDPIARTALVAEGGGQRGIFTAGVLDSWLESGYNTIPYKYLVSSEALSFFNSRHIDEEMVIPF